LTSGSSHSRASSARVTRPALDRLYERFNRREYTHPDPVELIYRYERTADREVAALVAALLSLGRVRHILKSAADALERLGSEPGTFVDNARPGELGRAFEGFRHRFTTGSDMAATLEGVQAVRRRWGGVGSRLAALVAEGDETVLGGLESLVSELEDAAGSGACGRLLPLPRRRSACKRLHLYLRWMVRQDDVDPGGWRGIPTSKLVVPLDTHMHRIALGFGMTSRRTADRTTALEVTAAFRALCPEDPVRYDFALTRAGIHPEVGMDALAEAGCGLA
jgi:uncharacterized protein (TIGR02757 family)